MAASCGKRSVGKKIDFKSLQLAEDLAFSDLIQRKKTSKAAPEFFDIESRSDPVVKDGVLMCKVSKSQQARFK